MTVRGRPGPDAARKRMSSLHQQVAREVARHGWLVPGERVLVGVSGGVDSVVLLDILHRLGYAVEVAHVNYGLRGAASEADEAFVRAMAARLGVRFHGYRPDLRARAPARSLQEVAREVRYTFFAEVAAREHIGHVAVAHHRDDQAETLLLNLCRGAGLEGLAGMAPRRPLVAGGPVWLVRPLLPFGRDEILDYARTHGLPWREDATNAGARYRRGAVRHEILPVLEAHFGTGVRANLARTATLVRAYLETEVAPIIAFFLRQYGQATPDGGALALEGLACLPEGWRRRLILEAVARWLPEVPYRSSVARLLDDLLEAQPGRRVVFPGGSVWREREVLRFVRSGERVKGEAAALQAPGDTVVLSDGVFQVRLLPGRPEAWPVQDPHREVVDADRLVFPLVIRPWQAGDRFQPFGLKGHQKVSDLLTQRKVPASERERVRVVCAGERIVWVVGHRLAEAVRVRDETVRFAEMTFVPFGSSDADRTGRAPEGDANSP